MKLAARLLIAPLLTAVVAVGAGTISTLTHQRDTRQMQAFVESDLKSLGIASAARQQLADIHTSVYRTQAIAESLDDASLTSFRSSLSEQLDGVQRVLGQLVAEGRNDAALTAGAAEVSQVLGVYRARVDKAIELTSIDTNTGVGAMKAADASFTELRQSMQAVLDRNETLRTEFLAASTQRAQLLTLLLGALGIVATLGALAFGWRTQRRIVGDIRRAVQVSQAVAAGDLTQNVHSTRSDEIGELLRSTGHMLLQLRESLHTVRQATDNIRTAAEEIASGNIDLSQRTEQAASNLQQTASSMAQLTGTVGQTADSAKTAHQLAATASSVAQRGGEAVQQVIGTMSEINSSSHRIGAIIGTIDGIAFQTNILALNAAVEAARAGEQGRGFAVVASEVRSLAQRSAEAAREIKTLIQASVEKVEGGTRQVQDAGNTMAEIVASVQRVSNIVGEISLAAAEQSNGIGQVNGAVGQLDQVTQQNAALVEQSAAAAESLKEQAALLGAVLSRFQLGAGSAGAPATSLSPAGLTQTVLAHAASPAKKSAIKTVLKPASAATKPAPRPAPRPAPKSTADQPAATAAASDSDWETF
jgi:methyl-accepting chemotaxis protein